MWFSITIILVAAMICGTILGVYYLDNYSEEVNSCTLRNVEYLEEQIRKDIEIIKDILKQKEN